MISELPKIFDKNFAIAYFLPVSLFMAASAGLLIALGDPIRISFSSTAKTIFDVSLVAFSAWIASILLMVLNREIYRILEGYGKWNPLRIFGPKVRREYAYKMARLKELEDRHDAGDDSEELLRQHDKLMEELAQQYPDREEFLLPTMFGNTLRAFESYPRVMYGMEAVDGWIRILAVVPKEYRELIDDAKAQVDWWVNLGVVSLAYLLEFWYLVFQKWGSGPYLHIHVLNFVVPVVVFGLFNWFLSWRATRAATGWGDYIKSAFDLYRFRLLDALSIDLPRDRTEERAIWEQYSQAVAYRLPANLPELKSPAESLSGKKE
jgi:hypothetical protein